MNNEPLLKQLPAVILCGGGIDSIAVLMYCAALNLKHIVVVHVDYGQKASASESSSCRSFAKIYGAEFVQLKADLSFSGSAIMKDGDTSNKECNRLELRNPFLISLAASWAVSMLGDCNLLLGFHIEDDNVFPDAKTDYLGSLETAINLATKHTVALHTPFSHNTRQQIFDWAYNYDRRILQAHSCYEEVPCGACTHCKQLIDFTSKLETYRD
jgi:queuosine biosynthesis protein QueC